VLYLRYGYSRLVNVQEYYSEPKELMVLKEEELFQDGNKELVSRYKKQMILTEL